MRTTIRLEPENAWDLVDQPSVDRFHLHDPVAAVTVRAVGAESGLVNTGKMATALGTAPPSESP